VKQQGHASVLRIHGHLSLRRNGPTHDSTSRWGLGCVRGVEVGWVMV
jgi:hypothetical protein